MRSLKLKSRTASSSVGASGDINIGLTDIFFKGGAPACLGGGEGRKRQQQPFPARPLFPIVASG